MNSTLFPSLFAEQRLKDAGAYKEAACPCCGGRSTTTLYHADSIPVHSCVLLDTEEQARAFPRRDLQLAFCPSCGFLFNEVFDESVMSYAGNFEESQHFSDTFSSFARDLADEIAQKCAIEGKRVLEIGCGKGEFLRELCRVGGASGLGVDPGYRADVGRGPSEDGNVQFVVDYYKPGEALSFDVVLCRHTLEHIAKVREFIASIREGVGDRHDRWVVFETPDAKRVLEEGAFWDIYYEHCSYFSAGTHARLFRQEGFDVNELTVRYRNQYIVQYARPASRLTEPRLEFEQDLVDMRLLADSFPSRVKAVQDEWRDRARCAYADGKKVVIWGGGSKGVSFLTTLGLDVEIFAVVDVNPYKQGKFMPGAGHKVIAPSGLGNTSPDLVIVMNPIYAREIANSLAVMNMYPEIAAVGA